MSSMLASTAIQAGALLGVAGVQAGAQENAAVQNSSVFNPVLSFNNTGFKDSLSSGTGASITILILFVIGIAIVFLMFK